jgi:hypothetical protein
VVACHIIQFGVGSAADARMEDIAFVSYSQGALVSVPPQASEPDSDSGETVSLVDHDFETVMVYFVRLAAG